METDNINQHFLCFLNITWTRPPSWNISRLYIRIKFLLCAFLFMKTYILAKLIFHKNVKKMIWKFVPF